MMSVARKKLLNSKEEILGDNLSVWARNVECLQINNMNSLVSNVELARVFICKDRLYVSI